MSLSFPFTEREARKNEFSAKLEAIQLSKDEDEDEVRP